MDSILALMRIPATYREILGSDLSRRSLRTLHDNGDLIRPWRGVYASNDDEVQRLQALFKLLPPGSRLGGASAAAWYGFGGQATSEIHVVIPQGATHSRLSEVKIRESVLPMPEPVVVHGIPLLPPERVAVDLARLAKRLDALPILDSALRSGTCTQQSLAAELSAHRGLRGVVQVRELAELADPRPECWQESQLRLIIVDAGLPRPTPQLEVEWYRLDLGYEDPKIGLEYDGRSHITRDRLRADRRRMNYLAARGWRMRYFTDYDLYRRPEGIAATIRDLLRRS